LLFIKKINVVFPHYSYTHNYNKLTKTMRKVANSKMEEILKKDRLGPIDTARLIADNNGSIIRNREDMKKLLFNNVKTTTIGLGAGAAAGAAIGSLKGMGMLGGTLGAVLGSTAGSIKSSVDAYKFNSEKARSKGFKYNYWTGTSKKINPLEKKAFWGITPFTPEKSDQKYNSLKGYVAEVGNRSVGAAAGALPGAIIREIGVRRSSPALLAGGTLATIAGAVAGDYKSVKATEKKQLGKTVTTPMKYVGRGLASGATGTGYLGDYLVSRHMYKYD
jgi:hypothetical protein